MSDIQPDRPKMSLRAIVAYILLAMFAVSATIGGFFISLAAGFGAFAISCLIVSLLLGWEA